MISVAQNKGGIDAFEVLGCKCLDRGLSPYRRKDRSLQITMRCGKNPCAGAIVFRFDGELKHIRDYTG